MSATSVYTLLQRGWLSSNNIVFHQGIRTAVVDTGYRTHVDQKRNLLHVALRGRTLDAIINAHLHAITVVGTHHCL